MLVSQLMFILSIHDCAVRLFTLFGLTYFSNAVDRGGGGEGGKRRLMAWWKGLKLSFSDGILHHQVGR